MSFCKRPVLFAQTSAFIVSGMTNIFKGHIYVEGIHKTSEVAVAVFIQLICNHFSDGNKHNGSYSSCDNACEVAFCLLYYL